MGCVICSIEYIEPPGFTVPIFKASRVLLGMTFFSWQNIADKILCNEICMTKYPVSSPVVRIGNRESG